MARKKIPATKKITVAGVSFPPEILKQGKQLAFQSGVSFSKMVSDLVRVRLELEAAK